MTLPVALAELPLAVEGYELERLELPVSPEFTRVTTVVHLHGGGEKGVGEDVTYSNDDQDAFQAAGPAQPLTGSTSFRGFVELVGSLDLFPAPPQFPAYRLYRRWAFESAALDLALRQAGRPLHAMIGREPQPVRFVNSMRLGDPATIDPVRRRLELYPWLEFKLDATSSWTDELVEELAATGAVESVDLKGRYSGTSVDQGPDAALYRRVAEGFPNAWIEDPALTPETEEVLAKHWERVTWDEPIHSIADLEALPHRPKGVNLKPSRIGSLADLLDDVRLLRSARDPALRRRPVRARPRPRADPVPRLPVPRRLAERCRAAAVQRARAAPRAAVQPARAGSVRDRLSLGLAERVPRTGDACPSPRG